MINEEFDHNSRAINKQIWDINNAVISTDKKKWFVDDLETFVIHLISILIRISICKGNNLGLLVMTRAIETSQTGIQTPVRFKTL